MPAPYRVEKWREVYRPNAAMLRHVLVSESYEVFQWSDLPGAFYGSHMHEEEQSHWIVSGTLELTLDTGRRYVLEPGDRDFMPARTYHSARVLGEESCVYLVGSRKPQKPRKKKGRPSAKREIENILKELGRFGR